MGVHGLWELLAPVGRRVSVESLSNKKLAIDASIWIIQFMKAMRDERGDMIRNAHLLGFFRRICKLLFLRVKPVFVFDGGTPALKRRTVIARRRQREKAQSRMRKTAEKLLLNHLRTRKLEEIARNVGLTCLDLKQEKKQSDYPYEQENILSTDDLPKSMPATASTVWCNGVQPDIAEPSSVADCFANESTDILLATSLVAESESDGSDEEDDEEVFILPSTQGQLDTAVLASLPPSMQLDLLVQMREQLVAENRQKFQKVAKEPASFSQLQIQAYLKTVAFRREINEVQKCAAGKGVGGVPSARIASETDREFIFSSSFHGKKQSLDISSDTMHPTSGQTEEPPCSGVTVPTNAAKSDISSQEELLRSGTGSGLGLSSENSVQTYVDDNGRTRVSRVRGMGVRMTRDIQWNLYLMRDKENHKGASIESPNLVSDVRERTQNESQVDTNSNFTKQAGLEISFFDDGDTKFNNEDTDLFGALVRGEAVLDLPSFDVDRATKSKRDVCMKEDKVNEVNEEGGYSLKGSDIQHSELEIMRVDNLNFSTQEKALKAVETVVSNQDIHMGVAAGCGESDVEWEDGSVVGDGGCISTIAEELVTPKLMDLEAAQLEEAIRRSLEDFGPDIPLKGSSQLVIKDQVRQEIKKTEGEGFALGRFDDNVEDAVLVQECRRRGKAVIGASQEDNNLIEKAKVTESAVLCASSPELEGSVLKTNLDFRDTDACEPVPEIIEKNNELFTSKPESSLETSSKGVQVCRDYGITCELSGPQIHKPSATFNDTSHKRADESLQNALCTEGLMVQGNLHAVPADSIIKKAENIDMLKNMENLLKNETELLLEKEELARQQAELHIELEAEQEAFQTRLEEERELLLEEELELQNAQRKNERNAESVTGEMFGESQELLQMFGLPYIIAPMEAEAQCAFMNSIQLVDGVVTDDCDVFLFGGTNVYKNIFDDRKYVETYYMKDVEADLGIDREKLIHMALLLGSDYTEGISGIGIVNAIEVVNAFPGEDGLKKFKDWLDSPDLSLLGKIKSKSSKKLSKMNRKQGVQQPGKEGVGDDPELSGTDAVADISHVDGAKEADIEDDQCTLQQLFMEKHCAVSKNWNAPDSFPNEAVISAYKFPQVDKSSEPFSWGRPDLEALRRLCSEKFGWSKDKADELLLPVLKEYDRHETQLRLDAFYSFNQRFAKIRSERIQKAVMQITGRRSAELMHLHPHLLSPATKRKIKGHSSHMMAEENLNADIDDESNQMNSSNTPLCSVEKKSRMKHTSKDTKSTNGARGKGRGKTQRRGIGRKEDESYGEQQMQMDCKMASKKTDSDEILDLGALRDQHLPRRSSRPRQRVTYTFSDSDKDDSTLHSDEKVTLGNGTTFASTLGVEVEMEFQTMAESVMRDSAKDSTVLEEGKKSGDFAQESFAVGGCLLDQSECGFDYLATGGGFCPSEQEIRENDTSAPHAQNTLRQDDESKTLMTESIIASSSIGEEGEAIFSAKARTSSASAPHIGLRAVPLLKRKRRSLT